MMKFLLRIALAAMAAFLLTACSGSDSTYQYKTEYLPVQLVGSEKWSILDVNNGEVVVKDAFDTAPSPIVNGMFYVMNEDGSYHYYDVSAPTKPVSGPWGSVTAFRLLQKAKAWSSIRVSPSGRETAEREVQS